MKKTCFVAAILLVAGMASMVLAKDATKKTEAKSAKPNATPSWVVMEDDWWFPFRYDFSDTLRKARTHYRAGQEKAASAEIDKAISWLKYAESHANKSTAEDLSTARSDLFDYSMALKNGEPVLANRLEPALAHASAALAKHHRFESNKALAKGDLKTAAKHLMVAVDYLRDAARYVNYEYGDDFVTIYDDYAPYGCWDETVVLDKNKLQANLTTVTNELEKLAAKLK